jgi:hypothetical protein
MRDAAGESVISAAAGLCGTCANAVAVRSDRGSVFVRCTHPELPKYPRLPVVECRGWEAIAPASAVG